MNQDTPRKNLRRRAAEKVAEALKWLRDKENGVRKLKIEHLDTIWCYARKGDILPETDMTDPEVEQQALQDGFYFAATTCKRGGVEYTEHTWLGGLDTDTFIAYLDNNMVNLTETEIEGVRVGASASLALRKMRVERVLRSKT